MVYLRLLHNCIGISGVTYTKGYNYHKTNPTNYGSISLLNVISKIFEKSI